MWFGGSRKNSGEERGRKWKLTASKSTDQRVDNSLSTRGGLKAVAMEAHSPQAPALATLSERPGMESEGGSLSVQAEPASRAPSFRLT